MKIYKEYFSENNLNDMYDRTIKLLNGENKDTYGFAPAEIQQLIREIKGLKSNIILIKNNLETLKHRLNYEEDYCMEDYDIDKILQIIGE